MPKPVREVLDRAAPTLIFLSRTAPGGQDILVQVAKEPIGAQRRADNPAHHAPGRHLSLRQDEWDFAQHRGRGREESVARDTLKANRCGIIVSTAPEGRSGKAPLGSRFCRELGKASSAGRNAPVPSLVYQEPISRCGPVRDFLPRKDGSPGDPIPSVIRKIPHFTETLMPSF